MRHRPAKAVDWCNCAVFGWTHPRTSRCPMPRHQQPQCPHGAPIGECQACDEAADFQYDVGRESRIFGR